jgi:eukaryotic-like serine/threonine-protein kinase
MSGSAAPERPPEGPKGPRVLGGYELIERIGQSRDAGTLTFRARQTSLGRTVRVVVLPPQSVAKPNFRTRFERRVAVASRLRHDNVVSAIDAGAAGGCLYVVFEDVHGRTLADALAGAKPLPLEQVLEIGIAIARGLDHVAAQGLVHRNVVPGSILLPEHGPPKLAGLGTAKVRVAGGAETWMDRDLDAASFAAPELVKGQRGVDVRADVYGLGCVLYHAATGCRVFAGGSAATVLARHGSEAPADPRSHVPSLPEAFVRVLDRCLRKLPRERYQKPAELAADLETVKAGRVPERGPGTPYWKDRVLPVPSILRRRGGG